jgi:hypothetical protein
MQENQKGCHNAGKESERKASTEREQERWREIKRAERERGMKKRKNQEENELGNKQMSEIKEVFHFGHWFS